MTEVLLWVVFLVLLIAAAAAFAVLNHSHHHGHKQEKFSSKQKSKSIEIEESPVNIESDPLSKKSKKKSKKKSTKERNETQAKKPQQKPQQQKPQQQKPQQQKPQQQKPQQATSGVAQKPKGKSREIKFQTKDGVVHPTITQALAAREEQGESKKKKRVDLHELHWYFGDKKSRDPISMAIQFGVLYRGTEFELEGCVNDLRNAHEHFLKPMGFEEANVLEFTDDTEFTPTKRIMESTMHQLVNNAMPGDRLFIQYSGHGTEVRDRSGDEADGFDEAFCPLDGGVLIDDWLFLNTVKPLERHPGASLFFLVDACHSGTCLDLQIQYYATRGEHPTIRVNVDHNPKRTCTSHVLGFSAAMDDQTATDIQGQSIPQGAFTEMFLEVFRKHQKKPLSFRRFILETDALLAKAGYAQQASLSASHKLDLDHEARFWS